jgi:hypothetical protein
LWIYPDSPKHLHYSETIISALMSIFQTSGISTAAFAKNLL